MKTYAAIFIAVLMILSALPAFPQTQLDLTLDACADYKQEDKRLNLVYQQVMKKYASEPLTIRRIRESEVAWLKYRDAELKAVFPQPPSTENPMPYGSVHPMCVCNELYSLTKARIERLEGWLNAEEGEVCTGSRAF